MATVRVRFCVLIMILQLLPQASAKHESGRNCAMSASVAQLDQSGGGIVLVRTSAILVDHKENR